MFQSSKYDFFMFKMFLFGHGTHHSKKDFIGIICMRPILCYKKLHERINLFSFIGGFDVLESTFESTNQYENKR